MRRTLTYILVCFVLVLQLLLAACGGPTLTAEQQQTATANSAFATFAALPAASRDATATAVMQKINEGLK